MLGDTASIPTVGNGRDEENIPAAITDIGCEREINEDRYAVVDSGYGRSWIVCDGMGGAMGGELAAQLAIDAVRRSLENGDYDSTKDALRSAIEEANRVIVLRRQNPAFSGMGTTVVAALINEDEVIMTHAGDSRAYLIRDGVLQQLTTDHTYVQDLVERGAITHEEALSHPQSHVLTRCLGAEPRLELDMQEFWIWSIDAAEPEDKLVLCSDGLYSLVSDDEIAQMVSKHSPQESCVQLIELAKSRGGYDNITLAIIPLGGQLREESAGPRDQAPKKRMVRQPARPRGLAYGGTDEGMPLSKKILLMFIFLVLGSAVAALIALLSIAGQ